MDYWQMMIGLSCLLVGILTDPDTFGAASDATPKHISIPAPPDGVVMPLRGICAHRGANDTHPENTLVAFREAIRLGVQQIEFDVCMTADKRLVIMHDSTVDRTTDGSGKVADMTLAAIQSLDAGSWKGNRFAGVRVPTLRQILDSMPLNIWLNVHVKDTRSDVGAAVAREIVAAGRLHQSFLHCAPETAAGAHSVDPAVMICNVEHNNRGVEYVTATLQRGCQFIQYFRGEPVDIARAEAAGVMTNYCCADDTDRVRKLFEMGIDFVLVNDTEAMMQVAKSIGIAPVKPIYPHKD